MALHDLPCLQYLPARIGALLAAAAIGLSAWASHGLEPGRAQYNVLLACLYAFAHGAVLAAAGRHVAVCRQPGGQCAGWLAHSGGAAGWHDDDRRLAAAGLASRGWATGLRPGLVQSSGWKHQCHGS